MIKSQDNVTLETVLTIKEAAVLTGLSVPTFYTPKRRAEFGFGINTVGDVNTVTVAQLVELGLLTDSFEPTRWSKNRNVISKTAYNDVMFENDVLKRKIQELTSELEHFKQIADERGQHIDMLAKLMGVSSS